MAIYVDVSDFYRTRGRSGIQRMVREIVGRMRRDVDLNDKVIVIKFSPKTNNYQRLPDGDVDALFEGALEGDNSDSYPALDINGLGADDIFFDIDNAWNVANKRPVLYKKLKSQKVKIQTVAYDMIPITNPQHMEANTLRNFVGYVAAMLAYCDLIYCISRSTERDIQMLASETGAGHVNTSVIRLGADFGAHTTKTATDEIRGGIEGPFIIMVGTLEPRKRQDKLIDAFSILAKRHKDLSLVLVGRAGWHSEAIVSKIKKHPLNGSRLHWLDDVGDAELDALYNKADYAAYLSSKEGFGLPVAEGLSKNKITIAFDNSSHFEAGGNYADYARLETAQEVADIIGAYIENPHLKKRKLDYIKNNKSTTSWDQAYVRFRLVFQNMRRADKLLTREIPERIQIVFISNRIDDLRETIKQHDQKTPFVKEYVVFAPKKMLTKMRKIKSKHPLKVIDEIELLGDHMAEFKKSDHSTKNWMLRSSISRVAEIDEEFIMNDDDSRPLRKMQRTFFVGDDGKYNAHYFYELPRWVHRTSDYDDAQRNMSDHLGRLNLEQLNYSSHQPQLINKKLFAETVSYVNDNEVTGPIDEWSTYFNYIASILPSAVNKRPFESLAWPADPRNWEFQIRPPRYTMENFYEELYEDGGVFEGLKVNGDSDKKVDRMTTLTDKYEGSVRQMQAARKFCSSNNMAHGAVKFENDAAELYISGMPYVMSAHAESVVRIELNAKLIAKGRKKPKSFRIELLDNVGRVVAGRKYPITDMVRGYDELVISLPLIAGRSSSRYVTLYAFVDEEAAQASYGNAKAMFKIIPVDEAFSL